MLTELAAEAERVLRRNWREGVTRHGDPYAFTCPSPGKYKHQWYWDSCFHAIAWSRIDPARARAELRTLVRAGRLDGFVPHTAFWGAKARWRRAPFYATVRIAGDAATASTQTPLLAFAWEIVAAASGQDAAAFVREGVDSLRAHADWLDRERDPDRDGLISIVLPDESGLDDSPKYDPVYGHMVHWGPGYFRLVQRCRRRRWNGPAIIGSTDHHVEDVLVNVAHVLSLRALSRMLQESDDGPYARLAARTEEALLERCWDERSGLFLDLAGRRERPVNVSTWSSFAPLALGDAIPEDIRRRMIEEHLLHPRRYRAPFGIPSVSMEDPRYRPGFYFWRTWRGPSWINTAWLLVPALDELGYRAEGDRIVDSLALAVKRHGYREYYNPHDGTGHGARDFGWSTLLVDLIATRARAYSARPA